MKFSESEHIELKKSTSELREAVVSISAILNKHGHGKLYFGIKNDGQIVGLTVSERTLREISQTIADNLEPRIYPEIKKIELEGKSIVEVSFAGKDAPYFAHGRVYKRVGDEDRQLSARELESLILVKNKGKVSWDNQLAKITLSDIDSKAVRYFVRRSNEAGRMTVRSRGVETLLKKMGLLQDGILLNAAQVFFTDKNPAKVQAAVFAGKDKLTFLDIRQFEGNAFLLIKKSEEYLKEKMNWKVGFGRMEREEIPEVPLAALREALINSICHRDYAAPESNYIAVYKDRIEIDNPGSFPEGMDPEDFIFKDEQSVLRNPLIADILYRTKDIEKWGSGLKRIFEECREKGVHVEFKKLKTGFRVVFNRREEFAKPDSDPVRKKFVLSSDKVRNKLGENAGQVFVIIIDNPSITAKELASRLGLSLRGIQKIIAKMQKEGMIKRRGARKSGYWEIIAKE